MILLQVGLRLKNEQINQEIGNVLKILSEFIIQIKQKQ